MGDVIFIVDGQIILVCCQHLAEVVYLFIVLNAVKQVIETFPF